MTKKKLKPLLIGTRSSPLALWQAEQVNKKLDKER